MNPLTEEDGKIIPVDDEELQQYLYSIISARTLGPLNATELTLFMDNHFETSDKKTTPSTMPRCQDTLDYRRSTLDAVDFFVEFCILIFAKAYGAPPGLQRAIKSVISGRPAEEQARLLSTSLPLSMWRDKRRIRRALLRFQL